MRRISLLAMALLTMGTTPAYAQMFNYPFVTMRSGVSATTLVAVFGRGLNDASGKQNLFGAAVARSGIGGRFSVRAQIGLVDSSPDSEMTFGGAVQVRLNDAASPTALTALAGVGYMKPGTLTLTRFPIGVGLSRTFTQASGMTIAPTIVPRLEIGRASGGGTSTTETDFGAAGALTIRLPSGLGFGAAVDLVASDPSFWLFGANIQYSIQ